METGAEINLDPRSLKDGYKLVFRLGGLATSWEVQNTSASHILYMYMNI